MAATGNPLAPDPVTNIDGPEVFPPIEPIEDLGEGVPIGEPGNAEPDPEEESVDSDDPL